MTHPTKLFAVATALLLVSGGAAACDDDGVGPEPIARAEVAASYEATTFTTTTAGETTDELAGGAEIALVLAQDGTTAGRLFVPGGAEGGADLDASLEGTWTFDAEGSRVDLDHTADTFLRDMTFTAVRAGGSVSLRGEETFGATTAEVVLEQQ